MVPGQGAGSVWRESVAAARKAVTASILCPTACPERPRGIDRGVMGFGQEQILALFALATLWNGLRRASLMSVPGQAYLRGWQEWAEEDRDDPSNLSRRGSP